MPAPSEIVRADTRMVENTLDLPTSEFRYWLLPSLLKEQPPQGAGQLSAYVSTSMIAAPWERERARRLNRLISAELLTIAAREPADRQGWTAPETHSRYIMDALENTPKLMMSLFGNAGEFIGANDYNLVHRRALELILGLRSWQLKHGGRLPDELEALVPDELPSIPKDPYTNQPFIYARWENEEFVRSQPVPDAPFSPDSLTPRGSRMLHSFGASRLKAPESSSGPMKGTPSGPISFLIPGADDVVKRDTDVKAEDSSRNRPPPPTPK
jgi:hypothetical protein